MAEVESAETPETAETTETHGIDEMAIEPHDVAHHPHPSAYVGIAVILAVLTAVEVGLFYVEDLSDTWNTVLLLGLMVLKFALVALWFMHLRFEAPIFKRLFVGAILLAVSVYAVALAASDVFPLFVD